MSAGDRVHAAYNGDLPMRARILGAFVVLAAAVGVVAAAEPIKVKLDDFKLKSEGGDDLVGYNADEMKLFFYTNGTATATVKVPEDGEYTITIEASCDEAEKEKAKFKLTVGDVEAAKSFELKATEAKEYPFTAKLKKGDAKLVIEFLNDAYKENEFDRNLYVHAVKLEKKK
jgi:hypothetical protein